MKNQFIYTLYTLALFFVSLGFASCNNDPDDDELRPLPQARRTVLIYMCAENSLGSLGYHRSDSVEIMKGREFISSGDRLLMYIDDHKNPRLYQVDATSDSPKLVRQWNEELCSASPETLQQVLTWMAQKFPADEYGLVMWSHADGWIPAQNPSVDSSDNSVLKSKQAPFAPYSWGIDVGAGGSMSTDKGADGKLGDQMNIENMAQAIEQSGVHLKYIFFDACMMQTLEVGYALRRVTDYVVASPIAITAYGANYTHQLECGLFSAEVTDIIKTYHADIVDPYQASLYSDSGIVFAVVKTSALDQLAQATNMALQLSDINAYNIPDLEGAQHYHTYTSHYYYRPHQYDARMAMQYVLTPQAFALYDEALKQAVVAQVATSRFWAGPSYYSYMDVDTVNYCGVSAFIPQEIYTQNAGRCPQGDLNQAFLKTEWSKAAGWHTLLQGE